MLARCDPVIMWQGIPGNDGHPPRPGQSVRFGLQMPAILRTGSDRAIRCRYRPGLGYQRLFWEAFDQKKDYDKGVSCACQGLSDRRGEKEGDSDGLAGSGTVRFAGI
jgi:hypothetical protein